jgi:His-Xaa-Ser system protein HxsD
MKKTTRKKKRVIAAPRAKAEPGAVKKGSRPGATLKKPNPSVERGGAFDAQGMDRVIIPVDKSVYPLDAVYSAAYVFLDRAYVYLEKDGKTKVKVSLVSKTPARREALLALGGEFVNELLGQAIRANLDESSKKIREYIVVKSHYAQPAGKMNLEGLLDQTLKEALDEDPLDIAVPWEEKYGKGGKKDEKKERK